VPVTIARNIAIIIKVIKTFSLPFAAALFSGVSGGNLTRIKSLTRYFVDGREISRDFTALAVFGVGYYFALNIIFLSLVFAGCCSDKWNYQISLLVCAPNSIFFDFCVAEFRIAVKNAFPRPRPH
jgi:ABC-type uncharacterized transport system permease subunit